jgi:thiol-disulfide isomerase/thioredoxin/uncharacterized membrane protein YphA (DoxX/SURF4 family)
VEVALPIIRALLAGVFFTAGLAKLADLEGSIGAVVGFGVPTRLARPLGTLLPFAELSVAALLAFGGTARIGAAGGFALLAAFSAGIGAAMARGESPDCHCFGQLHSEPAGPRTLARNLALAGLAAIALFAGSDPGAGLEDVGSLSGAAVAGILGGLLVAAILAAATMALLGVLRQNGRLMLRVEALENALRARGIAIPEVQAPSEPGLAVGSEAPSFTLPSLGGEALSLASLTAAGKPVLLFFTDPGCGPCKALMPKIGEWRTQHSGTLTIAAVARGDAEKMRAEAAEHGVEPILAEGPKRPVSESFEALPTPSAVLVDAQGQIASPVATGEPAITALVARTTAPALQVQQTRPGAKPGDPLPDAGGVTDLDGNSAELDKEIGGAERVLLFWDPNCGFCRRMIPDLQTLEREEPQVAESFLLVSRGDPEANRQQRLGVPMVLEQSFELGPKVGVQGTPSAVRIDAEGRIASDVAVGADAVLALARHSNGA